MQFKPIVELETADNGAFVDVLGMVERVDDWQTITRKTGEETKKRSVLLRDSSGRSVELTLWGGYVDEPGQALQAVCGRTASGV